MVNTAIERLIQQLRTVIQLGCIVATAVITIACSTVHKDFKPAVLPQAPLPDVPGKVAIVLPDSLCSVYYDNGNLTEFELGQVICQNARNAAAQAFPDARLYRSEHDIKPGEADFIGSVLPGKVLTYSDKSEIPAKTFARVNLDWSFKSVDESRQYRTTVYGRGKDVRTFGMADVRYESSMQECMDNLADNLLQEMNLAYDRAGKNTRTIAHIRETLAPYRPGAETYIQYLSDRGSDWHIYSVNESVKYNGGNYGYLNAPGLNIHSSTMGKWTSQWGKQLPTIQSLRPSFYLLDSKIDSSQITEVEIRETVGSAYDTHPMCELVFEGANLDTAILVEKTCDKDYTSEKAYTSKDRTYEQGFSNTARQWLQLRVGMSKQEIGALIGVPPSIEINTATNTTIFEYGYGRVRYSNQDGLIYWQLGEREQGEKDQTGPNILKYN